MNGHQNRSCRIVDGSRNAGFGNYSAGGTVAKAIETLKEHGLENAGWIGLVGFGIATIARIVGV